ncbi:MAG: DNA/RNA non-specific endonuclease [Alphaproteobacteria bacterium]|nr:DNA/RNA non-specific endonuclease [Alphaproteobacteria bacterium]MBO6629234.1 DNA/RNA non-specific endonuclease [Alphaproteobacteria bacterium]
MPDAITNGECTNVPKVDVDGKEDFYACGHLAPYFVFGGDGDSDGIDSEIEEDLKVEDIDDACTVFETNYMTNIAPQLHNSLNGLGGPWYKVETLVRDLAKLGQEIHVLAGTIFGDASIKTAGNPNDNRPTQSASRICFGRLLSVTAMRSAFSLNTRPYCTQMAWVAPL